MSYRYIISGGAQKARKSGAGPEYSPPEPECYISLLAATGIFPYNGGPKEELAVKLHVVRQTISKWEKGLSVPDSDMLLALSEALEAPVSMLLGEAVPEQETDELKAISEKLEVINLRFARQKAARRRVIRCLLLALCAATVLLFAGLLGWGSPYLDWDYSDPERAVVGVALHAFEWLFVRAAPIILAGSLLGLFLTRRRA